MLCFGDIGGERGLGWLKPPPVKEIMAWIRGNRAELDGRKEPPHSTETGAFDGGAIDEKQ